MNDYNYEKEVNEAIYACDNALRCLNQASTHLKSAGNWGVVDILGGGFISTLAKHSNMDNARFELEQAKRAVMVLKKELEDVSALDVINLDTGNLLSFADFFFDGFVADWLIQSKIRNTQNQVQNAINQITAIRIRLIASLNQ